MSLEGMTDGGVAPNRRHAAKVDVVDLGPETGVQRRGAHEVLRLPADLLARQEFAIV